MSLDPKPADAFDPCPLSSAVGSDTQEGNQASTLDQAGGLPIGLSLDEMADAELALQFLAEVKEVMNQSSRSETINELPNAIGRYRLERSLGRGGFAEVFMAWDDALQRSVALKIPLVIGSSNSEYRLRFEREARAAAMLTHPAIVPVYEYDSVGPLAFIAYRYVDGQDLASWLRENGGTLESREAARVVLHLADAMEHAHQRGLVHRDLKPANVMIDNQTSSGGRPIHERVLVTDFGLVKFFTLDQGQLTHREATIGTPAYMAPEQIEDSSRATPASDVWSLGVILFELLTGDVPFRGNGPLATMKAVQSGQISTPRIHLSSVPPDLLAICRKCLQREPSQRYASAFELAADLRRWLTGHPIEARAPSWIARLALWSRRNPAMAAASLVTTASLLVGLLGTTWQWRVAQKNMSRYQTEFERAENSLKLAQRALLEEQIQRKRAQKISQWLGSTYRSPDPRLQGREVKVVQVLERAEQEIAKQFSDDPETRWSLGAEIGKAWVSLGENALAQKLLKQIHEEQLQAERLADDSTIALLSELSTASNNLAEYPVALALAQHAGELAVALHGEESCESMKVQLHQADVLANLGRLVEANKIRHEAASYFREIKELELQRRAEKSLASGFVQARDLESATTLLERLIPEFEQAYGVVAPDTLALKTDYANALHHQKRQRELVGLRTEIFQGTEQALGPHHPQTLVALNNLAVALSQNGDREGALERWRDQLARTEIAFGLDSPYYFLSLMGPAKTLRKLDRWEESRACLETGVAGLQRTLGKSHSKTLTYWDDWLEVLEHEGRFADALQGWSDFQAAVLERDGKASIASNFCELRRGVLMILLGDVDAGLDIAESAITELQHLECEPDERQRRTWFAYAAIAQALVKVRDYSRAEEWSNRCFARGIEESQTESRVAAVNLLRAAILTARKRPNEAVGILRQQAIPTGEIPDKEREWIATAITELKSRSESELSELADVADTLDSWEKILEFRSN